MMFQAESFARPELELAADLGTARAERHAAKRFSRSSRTALANFEAEQRRAETRTQAAGRGIGDRRSRRVDGLPRCGRSSNGRSSRSPRSSAWCCSSRAPTSPICCSRAAPPGGARWRCAPRSARGGAGWCSRCCVESSVLTLAATAFGVLCAVLAVPLHGRHADDERESGLPRRAAGLARAAVRGRARRLHDGALRPRAGTARVGGHAGRGRRARQTGSHTRSPGVARPLVAVADRLQPDDPVRGRPAAALVRPAARGRSRLHTRAPRRCCRSKRAIASSRAQAREVGRQLLERVQAMPGVESASVSGWALFRGWSWGNNVEVPGGGRAQRSAWRCRRSSSGRWARGCWTAASSSRATATRRIRCR